MGGSECGAVLSALQRGRRSIALPGRIHPARGAERQLDLVQAEAVTI